jgi:hypothetical protein
VTRLSSDAPDKEGAKKAGYPPLRIHEDLSPPLAFSVMKAFACPFYQIV